MLATTFKQVAHCHCAPAHNEPRNAQRHARRGVVTCAADGDSAGKVEKQLNAIVSAKSKAPRLKKRPARKARKPKRAAPVDEEDDDAGLAALAGLAGGLGGLGLADDQLSKLLSGDTSEMNDAQLAKLMEGLQGMGEEQGSSEELEKELEAALEKLTPQELQQLLEDAVRVQGADGDPALAAVAGMLQGDTLDRMTDDELEGLYQELLSAAGPEDFQGVLQRTARSGPAGADETSVQVGDVEVIQGAGSSSGSGEEVREVENAEVAEEREGRAAFQKLMELIEEEDLENDPELADMRATFKQLKELAGGMESLTGSELTSKMAATVAELQQQVGAAVGVATNEEGQVDAQWQDALASTLAVLLNSSYKHYFQRPLLAGQEDVEGDSGDAATELYRRLEAAPACLLYLDYEAGDRQVVDWANQAVGKALASNDTTLEFCTMAELLPGGASAVQEWNEVAVAVWDNEPYCKVVPQLQLRVPGGQAATARDVEVFRVNSMGGEAIGLGLRFTRYDTEGGEQVVLADSA